MTRHHWWVLGVATLGWLFDSMDQRLFVLARTPALRALLGGLSDTDVAVYAGYATSIFILGQLAFVQVAFRKTQRVFAILAFLAGVLAGIPLLPQVRQIAMPWLVLSCLLLPATRALGQTNRHSIPWPARLRYGIFLALKMVLVQPIMLCVCMIWILVAPVEEDDLPNTEAAAAPWLGRPIHTGEGNFPVALRLVHRCRHRQRGLLLRPTVAHRAASAADALTLYPHSIHTLWSIT